MRAAAAAESALECDEAVAEVRVRAAAKSALVARGFALLLRCAYSCSAVAFMPVLLLTLLLLLHLPLLWALLLIPLLTHLWATLKTDPRLVSSRRIFESE